MKFCSKCGTQINDNSKFCGTCGAVQEVSQPLVQQLSNMQGQTDCLCDGKSIASMNCFCPNRNCFYRCNLRTEGGLMMDNNQNNAYEQSLVQQSYNGQLPEQRTNHNIRGRSIASLTCGIFGIFFAIIEIIISINYVDYRVCASESRTLGYWYEYSYKAENLFIAANVLGVESLILSIVSICLGCSYKKRSRAHNKMSKSGIIISLIGMLLFLIGIIILIAN